MPLAPNPAAPSRNLTLLRGFAWAALAAGTFTFWFIVTRFTVTRALNAWDVTALRFGVGALILGPLLLTARHRVSRRGLYDGIVLAALWGAPFVVLVAMGVQLTSAATASSVTPALMPVFAGLLGWALFRHRPGIGRVVGYAAVIVGQVALIASRAMDDGAAPGLWGVLLLVSGSFLWALYTVHFRRSGLSALQGAALICVWTVVLYMPPYLVFGAANLLNATWRELLFQAFYQGVMMAVLAVIAFNRAVSLLGAGAATAVIALQPVLTTMLAVPLLGEVPNTLGIVAVAVIAAGVFLAARPGR